MPAFTLYGSRGSTNTDRVRLTLAEGGFTDYEFVPLNLQKGEQKVCGLVLSQDVVASSCVSNSNHIYPIEPHFSIFSLTHSSILVEANAVARSPMNTRNVTRGVKSP